VDLNKVVRGSCSGNVAGIAFGIVKLHKNEFDSLVFFQVLNISGSTIKQRTAQNKASYL
jgi:hypothetical protein